MKGAACSSELPYATPEIFGIHTQPQRRRWFLVTMVIGATIMSFWDVAHRIETGDIDKEGESLTAKLILVAPPAVIRILASRAALVVSIMMALVSLAAHHYFHQHSQLLEIATVCGGGLGILLGTAAGLDETAILIRAFPWGVVIAVVLSIPGENVQKRSRRKRGEISIPEAETFAHKVCV